MRINRRQFHKLFLLGAVAVIPAISGHDARHPASRVSVASYHPPKRLTTHKPPSAKRPTRSKH